MEHGEEVRSQFISKEKMEKKRIAADTQGRPEETKAGKIIRRTRATKVGPGIKRTKANGETIGITEPVMTIRDVQRTMKRRSHIAMMKGRGGSEHCQMKISA